MTIESSNKARAEVRRHRLLALVAILIAAGTFGFLALGGLGKSLVYYWSPTELRAHGGKAEGATIRLGGLVAPGSIETGEGGLGLQFKMTDGTETVAVSTHGGAAGDVPRRDRRGRRRRAAGRRNVRAPTA